MVAQSADKNGGKFFFLLKNCLNLHLMYFLCGLFVFCLRTFSEIVLDVTLLKVCFYCFLSVHSFYHLTHRLIYVLLCVVVMYCRSLKRFS